jgi:tetratricopeptide (TPR) repeat protein
MERAVFEFSRYKQADSQVDLFFNFTFANLYQSLGYHLMAIRYAVNCKYIVDKFDTQNPNNALAYCCLGSVMFRIREYEWSLRMYNKAKETREYTSGGDSLDCATVYNNMGVCCYMLQNFWAANGYFQLAHEIYKAHLG